jgi:ubiquinone/menaquinone biosynthesis C-methylase UbiE
VVAPNAAARVRAVYDRVGSSYDRRWRRYLEESLEATLTQLDCKPSERVLDVGCGTGLLLAKLLRRQPTIDAAGIDLTPAMLDVARRDRSWRRTPLLAAADAAALPFSDSCFEHVVSTSALHHWPEPTRALAEIARVTVPGGKVVLTDWSRDVKLFRPMGLLLRMLDRSIVRIHSLEEVTAMAENAGLRVIRSRVYRVARRWGMMTLVAERLR